MSDSGGSGGGQFAEEVKGTLAEVAKDVTDAVGEAIEQGAQSVVGSPLTPQQIQQQQLEDQKKIAKVRKDIAWMRNVDESQKQVRLENAQKQQQKQQGEQQEKVEKVQIAQSKKADDQASEATRRAAAELKAGKGVGG